MKFDPVLPVAAACLLLASPVARGQSSTGGDNVTLKIDLVAWGDDIPGLSITSGGKGTTVTALPFRYSQPVAYSGPVLLEIYQNASAVKKPEVVNAPDIALPVQPRDDNSSDDNSKPLPPLLEKMRKDKPNLVALAKLPGNSRRATVLLGPGPAGTFQTYVLDDDPSRLPAGKMRIHNLSPFPVALRCNNNATAELKTGQASVVTPQEGHVIYELAYKDGEEWKVQENNIVRVGDKEQVQFVVLKSKNSFFVSSSGSQGGFLQTVTLRRTPG